jgi:hypothetical protein
MARTPIRFFGWGCVPSPDVRESFRSRVADVRLNVSGIASAGIIFFEDT